MDHTCRHAKVLPGLLAQVPVPAGLDVLLVEQEVVGTEESALQVGFAEASDL